MSEENGAAGEVTVSEWVESIEDENLKSTLGAYESQDKFFEAAGIKAPEPEKVEVDWRESIPEDLKKTADRFTSVEDILRSNADLRKRESQVRVPGKEASEEEVKAYQKAIGIPESPDEYEFPDLPEGYEMNEEVEASRKEWAGRFHTLGVSKDVAKQLSEMVNADAENMQKAQVEADKKFADAQEAALKNEWKGEEFERNKNYANRAFKEIAERAGVGVEDLTKIETKDGRFLMDRAEMVKLFATIGREMSEGSLGPTMSESEVESAEGQLSSLRKEIADAQGRGDSKAANKLYQKEQSLIAKISGNKPVVGSHGRAA